MAVTLTVITLAVVSPVRAADPPPFVPGSWTMVVQPDTQRYTDVRSDPTLQTFGNITQWIADNKDTLNIQLVMYEGDITAGNSNDVSLPPGNTWQVASDAMAILDNANVPYRPVQKVSAGRKPFENRGLRPLFHV